MKLLLVTLLTLAASTLPSHADTVYTYTGKSSIPGYSFVSGYFTTATPLAPDQPLTYVNYTNLAFYGGGNGFNLVGGVVYPNSDGGAKVATDAAGNIDYWYIDLNTIYGGGFYIFLMSVNLPTLTFDVGTQKYEYAYDYTGGVNGYGVVPNNPGTWTITQTGIPTSPTPEPATLLLACTALLALPLCLKRAHLRA